MPIPIIIGDRYLLFFQILVEVIKGNTIIGIVLIRV